MKQVYGIHIKFCGGCNPEIERGSVIKKFKELVASSELKDQLDFNHENGIDIIVLVNGCHHSCLNEDESTPKDIPNRISIQGEMMDLRSVKEDDLPQLLLQNIKRIISQ